jgi:hypothetical protein
VLTSNSEGKKDAAAAAAGPNEPAIALHPYQAAKAEAGFPDGQPAEMAYRCVAAVLAAPRQQRRAAAGGVG